MNKKRVVFCTNDSLCSSLVLDELLRCDHLEVVGIYLSEKVRTRSGSLFADSLRIIKTSGFSYAIYLALGTVIFECFAGRQNLSSVKQQAKKHGIQRFSHKDINAQSCIDWLTDRQPDILFSCFFNQKLAGQVLAIPRIDCLNLHPALLPKYKGVDPVFYYMLNQEGILGISLHRMDEGYDTGEVLASQSMAVQPGRSIFWHNVELFRLGSKLFQEWTQQPVETLREKSPRQSAGDSQRTTENDFYDSWPTPHQVSQLKTSLYRWQDFREQLKNAQW